MRVYFENFYNHITNYNISSIRLAKKLMFDYSINTLESQEWSTMYIQAIKFLNNWKINNQDQPRNREYLTGSLTQTKLPIFFYKDYNINFGARLNRTPENFYAQQFNIDNMPDTVKTICTKILIPDTTCLLHSFKDRPSST